MQELRANLHIEMTLAKLPKAKFSIILFIGMGYPVFAAGMRPVDSRGRSIVMEYDEPIECGGVPVRKGDLVFGDIDGVVVIPQAVAEQVVTQALQKVRQENASRAELERGGYLRNVYDKYGVL